VIEHAFHDRVDSPKRTASLDRGQRIVGAADWSAVRRRSDKEKFCNDLSGPKTPKMLERPLKALQYFETSKLNTLRLLSQMATISECQYRWLRVPPTACAPKNLCRSIGLWFIKSYSLLNMGRLRGANAKCVQLKYAIEVDRCRYRTIAQPKKYCCGYIRDRL
jgi:hypothetical protein